jgi:hypothetical protein
MGYFKWILGFRELVVHFVVCLLFKLAVLNICSVVFALRMIIKVRYVME